MNKEEDEEELGLGEVRWIKHNQATRRTDRLEAKNRARDRFVSEPSKCHRRLASNGRYYF